MERIRHGRLSRMLVRMELGIPQGCTTICRRTYVPRWFRISEYYSGNEFALAHSQRAIDATLACRGATHVNMFFIFGAVGALLALLFFALRRPKRNDQVAGPSLDCIEEPGRP